MPTSMNLRKGQALPKPPAPKVMNPSSPTNKKRSSGVVFKDDDPIEDLCDTDGSASGDDPTLSDYENKRKRPITPAAKRSRALHLKNKKLRYLPAPQAPDMSDSDTEPGLKFKQSSQSGQEIVVNQASNSSGDIQKGNVDSVGLGTSPMMKLPRELRIRIYVEVLVTEEPIMFHSRRDFQRDAQLLRTCRAIQQEAAPVLYGSNSFHFERTAGTRGRFFDEKWQAIGFRDIRRFLETIGPTNVSYLKHISFIFQDGSIADYDADDKDKRFFVNDEVLYRVLNIVSQHCVLHTLNLYFQSEQKVKKTDYHFLKALGAIRAANVKVPIIGSRLGFRLLKSSIQPAVREKLIAILTGTFEEWQAVNPKLIRTQVKMGLD